MANSKQMQSSQVDLLAKSEIFNGVAVVCDTVGVTLQVGSGNMLSHKSLKNRSS